MPSNFDSMEKCELASYLNDVIIEAKSFKKRDKLNAYLAAPWFDESALMLHNSVKAILRNVGEFSKYNIYFPFDHTTKNPEETFNENVRAIGDSEVIIALVSRKDVGTAWEIGYAYALGKKVYLVALDETCFTSKTNLMLAFSGRCFTIDKLAKFLTGKLDSVDYVQIGRTWEGIE